MCVEIEILIFITYESTDMPLICYGYMHIQIYMCVYIYIYIHIFFTDLYFQVNTAIPHAF